jgi:hypothetical protein
LQRGNIVIFFCEKASDLGKGQKKNEKGLKRAKAFFSEKREKKPPPGKRAPPRMRLPSKKVCCERRKHLAMQ